MSGLAHRLRDLKRREEDRGGLLGNSAANTLHEAAMHIERLERDNEKLRDEQREAVAIDIEKGRIA